MGVTPEIEGGRMNDWLLAVLVLVGMLFLHDVWRLIRKAITAVDRDQQILDQVTVYEPDDDDDGGPQFDIDLGWDEQTAVLEFIEQFRAIRAHYERRQQ